MVKVYSPSIGKDTSDKSNIIASGRSHPSRYHSNGNYISLCNDRRAGLYAVVESELCGSSKCTAGKAE